MAWLSAIGNVFYYLLLPVTTLLSWVLIALAPLLHLLSYLGSGMLLPFALVAKFEVSRKAFGGFLEMTNTRQTLYIYIGVAAVIGLVTGGALHLSSTVMVSLFNLSAVTEEKGRTAASVRAAREQRKLESAWKSSILVSDGGRWRGDPTMENYSHWLEKDKRKDDQSLLGQTIIEEDDDSEDVF